MRIQAKGLRGKLWDLETGQEILRPIWFDEAEGFCSCYQTNPFGRIVRDRMGDKLTWLLQGKFRWEPEVTSIVRRAVGHKCQLCTDEAEWSVGDEMVLPPVFDGGVLFSRGKMTGQRHYCSRHYQAPRIVDGKGEIMKVWDDAGGVRPQW
jgi:hypothetical protein